MSELRAAPAGDVDGDGALRDADLGALLSLVNSSRYVAAADLNLDGVLNQQDVSAFVWIASHPGADGDCNGYPHCRCIFYGEPGSCVGTANCAGGSGGGSGGTGEGDPGEGGGGENEGGNNNGGNGPPTRVEYDIDVYRTSGIEGVLDESLEETSGAFVAVNSDDDNYDGIADNHEASGQVSGENDLVRVVLRPVRHNLASPPNPWNAYLSATSAEVRTWQNADRTGPIASGQAFDARQEHTIYLEGLGVQTNHFQIQYSGPNGGDWIKLRTVAMPSGAANVPDYSKHKYVITPPQGVSPQWTCVGGQIDATEANECRVHWQQGAAVGRVGALLTTDFAICRDVNIVAVSISTPSMSHSDPIDGMNGVDSQGRLLKFVNRDTSVQAPAFAWEAMVSLTGPNGNRGVDKMKVGFVQNLQILEHRAMFLAAPGSLIANFHAQTYVDLAENTVPPWYTLDADATFFDPTAEHPSKLIKSRDLPRGSLPLTFDQGAAVDGGDDILDEFRMRWAFELFIVVHTRDEDGVAYLDRAWTARAKAIWSLNGTDVSVGQSVPYPWDGSGGGQVDAPVEWTAITTGERPAYLHGTSANEVLWNPTFTQER